MTILWWIKKPQHPGSTWGNTPQETRYTESMNKSNLDQAAANAAQAILSATHEPVAVSIQMLLQYISDNTGKDTLVATVNHVQAILDRVCEAVEPEQAVL